MANTFALVLVTFTFITGIIWFIDKFKWEPERKHDLNQSSAQNNMIIDEKKIRKNSLRSYWVETASSVFPVLLVILIIRSFIFEPFQIPSGSMMPTLLIGDFILVKKFSYGIKDPITQTTLISTGHPRRGDIAVFKYPKNPSIYYIKRVIGLPGDKISFNAYNKTLTISTECKHNKCSISLPITYSDIEPSNFVQTFNRFKGNEIVNNGFYKISRNQNINNGIRLGIRKEHLGDIEHEILIANELENQEKIYYKQPGQPLSTWVVPQGQYFMMGDNRDNSADSRYWGFVPEENFVGKVVTIWMSFEKQEGHWPTGIRLKRIGSIV